MPDSRAQHRFVATENQRRRFMFACHATPVQLVLPLSHSILIALQCVRSPQHFLKVVACFHFSLSLTCQASSYAFSQQLDSPWISLVVRLSRLISNISTLVADSAHFRCLSGHFAITLPIHEICTSRHRKITVNPSIR